MLLALLCIALISLLPNPVGAQVEEEPAIIEDTAPTNGTPDQIVIAFPEGQTCTVDAGATVTVRDPDGGDDTPFTFTNGSNATISVEQDQIIITINEEGEPPVPEDFVAGTGTVVSSTDIECMDDATGTPTAETAPVEGEARNADELADLDCDELLVLFRAESGGGQQYGDAAAFADSDVRAQVEVCLEREIVEGTAIDEDLPDTGGLSLIGLAVLGFVSAAAGLSVVRGGRG
jgi:hypothetical protein